MDIAQLIFGENEMVASIYVAVEFHDSCMAASLCHGAYTRLFAHPIGESGVEQLDVISAHILPYPFVEQCAEKVAPLFRADGKVGQFRTFSLSFKEARCRPS